MCVRCLLFRRMGCSAGTTFGPDLLGAWRVCEPTAPGAQLVWRGLRVRIGAWSGLKAESDMVYSEVGLT